MRGLLRLWAALACLACLAGGAGAAPAPPPAGAPQTAVFWRATPLTDAAGRPAGAAPALSAWQLLTREGDSLWLALPAGGRAMAPDAAAAVLPGPPQSHRPRLRRLAAANLAPELTRRLAAGRVAAGDNQREVALAWGPPWRSYMVNLFADEEHFVYRGMDGAPILLRFKSGRLQDAPPAGPAWVAGGTPPR
ncbi:MAG: hypothetical protein V1797_09030 [Pseudomonadota bacterium]